MLMTQERSNFSSSGVRNTSQIQRRVPDAVSRSPQVQCLGPNCVRSGAGGVTSHVYSVLELVAKVVLSGVFN